MVLVSCRYVYKRMKFLGSKLLSEVVALLFLALWHGFWPGYFLTFIGEACVLRGNGTVLVSCRLCAISVVEVTFSRATGWTSKVVCMDCVLSICITHQKHDVASKSVSKNVAHPMES